VEKWTPEREARSRHASHAFGRGSSVWMRMLPQSVEDVFGPGRASLQWSVILSAFTILVPMLGIGAIWFALRCRRQNGARWFAALLAACWCMVLGAAFRLFGGLPIIP
jgi:hypothetical protein